MFHKKEFFEDAIIFSFLVSLIIPCIILAAIIIPSSIKYTRATNVFKSNIDSLFDHISVDYSIDEFDTYKGSKTGGQIYTANITLPSYSGSLDALKINIEKALGHPYNQMQMSIDPIRTGMVIRKKGNSSMDSIKIGAANLIGSRYAGEDYLSASPVVPESKQAGFAFSIFAISFMLVFFEVKPDPKYCPSRSLASSYTIACPRCGSTSYQMVTRNWSPVTGFFTNKVDRVCTQCKKRY